MVHAAGYGLADLSANVAIASDTIFHLASCGKQFTGLGILTQPSQARDLL